MTGSRTPELPRGLSAAQLKALREEPTAYQTRLEEFDGDPRLLATAAANEVREREDEMMRIMAGEEKPVTR